jgi:uncharacterized protein YecT (DUF1311 family)
LRDRSLGGLFNILAAVAVAVSAQAQPSNIRYWRITGMIPEPWTHAAALPASARALVQSGVAFLDREVKGPPPLACKEPVYGGDHPVSVGELFGGRVPEDRLKETVERLGIAEVAAHSDAFEVACRSEITNYFWFDGVDRLVRVGDAIYRMHPSDDDHAVDPDAWVQRPTPGFDCDKAQTTAEKLICRDIEIATADRTIADRYAALRAQETPESFATVRAAQRAWLKYTRHPAAPIEICPRISMTGATCWNACARRTRIGRMHSRTFRSNMREDCASSRGSTSSPSSIRGTRSTGSPTPG